MNQPASPSNPKPEKQPKTTPSKMATQLLLFFQIKKNTGIRDRVVALLNSKLFNVKHSLSLKKSLM